MAFQVSVCFSASASALEEVEWKGNLFWKGCGFSCMIYTSVCVVAAVIPYPPLAAAKPGIMAWFIVQFLKGGFKYDWECLLEPLVRAKRLLAFSQRVWMKSV